MKHAPGGGLLVEPQEVGPQGDGLVERGLPKGRIGRNIARGEHSDGDFGAGVVQSVAPNDAVGGHHPDEVAWPGVGRGPVDQLPEQLRVLSNRTQPDRGETFGTGR